MNKSILLIVALATVILADTLTTFQAGTPISASVMNNNFQQLQGRIAQLEAENATLKGENLVYDELERATGKTWFGKPVYRKVFKYDDFANRDNVNIKTSPEFGELVMIEAVAAPYPDNIFYPMNYTPTGSSQETLFIFVRADGDIELRAGGSWGVYNPRIIIEYTKK